MMGLKISLVFFGWKNIGRSAEVCCVFDEAVSDEALLHSHPEPQDDLACLVYDPSLQPGRHSSAAEPGQN